MVQTKNPVEKRIALLRELWLEATENAQVRVVVWRIPDNADRMMLAFFESQRHEGEWQVGDLFIKFDAPFETGFTYSRMLCEALIESYLASADSFKEQAIALNWPFAKVQRPDSAAGFLHLLDAFARHHAEHFRFVVAALMPAPITSVQALQAWLETALQKGVPTGVRLSLVDSHGQRRWDDLAHQYASQVRIIEAPIDLFDIARETAAQSPSTGPAVLYRQLLTDVLTLVEKGTPAQVGARAAKAMQIAEREKWPDQQVVLHMAVAGAHLKAQDHAPAIHHYRQARQCGEQAKAQGNVVGANLVMQTWFGEGGAWLTADQLRKAAQAYRSGAEEAQRMPNPLFALEGFRMAAFCYARQGDHEDARTHAVLALREGKAMAADERAQSTLGMALHDMLRMQDPARTAELEKLAEAYQKQIAQAHAKAETQGAALGAQPKNEDVDRIEAQMHAQFETAFTQLREQRERLIAKSDDFFRKVVAIARDLLHPQWAGLPEVKHPLDKEQASWTKMPQSAALPPAEGLIDSLAATDKAAA
jgi:tetratricopeptide (TPR) repeat protein